MDSLITLFYIFLVAALIILLGLVAYRLIKRRPLFSLDLRLLYIRVPKKTAEKDQAGKPVLEEEINLTEQIISALAALKKPFAFEASVHHVGEEIHFYLAVPRNSTEFAARQIQGLFPEAQVEEVDDYNIFGPTTASSAAYLTLKETQILPLRTYIESKIDTFAPIASTLSKLQESGEGASIQLVLMPASPNFKKGILGAIEKLRQGESFKNVLKMGSITMKDFQKLVISPSSNKKEDYSPRIVDEEAVKTLQAKVAKPLFLTNLRVVTAAQTDYQAEDLLMSITNSFSELTAPLRNEPSFIKPKKPKKLLVDFSFRNFNPNQAVVLNTEEIASMFHLPTFSTDVPRIAWLKTHETAPPANLPSEGIVIGENIFRGESRYARIKDDDRRRHLYIIGQTGTGKSFLQLGMAIQDIESGKGVGVIDPHGDLIDNILARIPEHRIQDVIVFNPGDIRRPLGINMLEYEFDNPEQKTFIVNEMQSIFNRLFAQETMGPIFEQYMRNTLLLLMEDARNEPATLMEVPRVLTDETYRKRKLARIMNPTVIDFWEKEAAKATGEQGLANMAPYITSKFNNFAANDYVRPIIGQTKSVFNFREVMDNGKILLVNLAKGKIGDINAGLLGMVITGKLLMSALSRVDVDQEKRRDFYLYIDEFQNFTTDSISVILSEARKYRLNLILAHQFIAQLTNPIRDAVFGNVGSKAVFRIGVPDQETMIKSFAPEFTEKDLLSLDNQNALLQILIDGQPARPFNIHTIKVEAGDETIREKLKELSRLTYGHDLADVEREIMERLRS